jgi:hypothetical protein
LNDLIAAVLEKRKQPATTRIVHALDGLFDNQDVLDIVSDNAKPKASDVYRALYLLLLEQEGSYLSTHRIIKDRKTERPVLGIIPANKIVLLENLPVTLLEYDKPIGFWPSFPFLQDEIQPLPIQFLDPKGVIKLDIIKWKQGDVDLSYLPYAVIEIEIAGKSDVAWVRWENLEPR